MNLIKRCYANLLQFISLCFGIGSAKKFDSLVRFHRRINLKNPKSLSDKVSYIELYDQSELAPLCTDKYAVREYIESKGLGNILVPVVGGPWDRFEDIDFSALPERFVIKATHGCKMNYMVENKCKLDMDECRKEIKRWLRTTYGTFSVEPHYYSIPHRIYAEEYLSELSGIIDYKFHCLNGIPQFVLTVSDRVAHGDKAMEVTLNLFDMQWNPIYEVVGANKEKAGDGNVEKPVLFDEMISICKELSKDFKFVRVDLYEINNKILFGELTFTPALCIFPYLSTNFLDEMGNKLTI